MPVKEIRKPVFRGDAVEDATIVRGAAQGGIPKETPVTRIKARACAKINLGLKILGLREDGFHELRTVFQTLALADRLEFELGPGRGVRFDCVAGRSRWPERLQAPADGGNLVVKAAEMAREAIGLRGQIRIRLEKQIPVQSGLGGGSSDAATVLQVLAAQARQPLPVGLLWRMAAELGSDVAPFLLGGTVLGLGRGEETYALPDLPRWHTVLAMPPQGVGTAGAFRRWDERQGENLRLTPGSASATISSFCGLVDQALPASRPRRDRDAAVEVSRRPVRRNASKVHAGIENDFESVVFSLSPDFLRIQSNLLQAQAQWVSLSGSGAAQYGLFAQREQAQTGARALHDLGPVWVTRFLPRSAYRRRWTVEG